MVAAAKMASNNMKFPPEPSTSYNYTSWKKEINIWKKLTDTPKEKRGLALQFVCRTNKKLSDAVLEIDEELVDCEQGLDNVLTVLDRLHDLDQQETALQCYEEFEALKRKDHQKVGDFIHQFETSANKTKNGNVLSDELLAYKLMRAVNLSETDQRILKASTAKFTYDEVKKTLKRSYGDMFA